MSKEIDSIDLLILNFKEELFKIINDDKYMILPITVKNMVLNEVKREVDITTNEVLKNELNKIQEKKDE